MLLSCRQITTKYKYKYNLDISERCGLGSPSPPLINANTGKVAKQSLPLSRHSPQVRYHSHSRYFYIIWFKYSFYYSCAGIYLFNIWFIGMVWFSMLAIIYWGSVECQEVITWCQRPINLSFSLPIHPCLVRPHRNKNSCWASEKCRIGFKTEAGQSFAQLSNRWWGPTEFVRTKGVGKLGPRQPGPICPEPPQKVWWPTELESTAFLFDSQVFERII